MSKSAEETAGSTEETDHSAPSPVDAQVSLPDHLMKLEDGQWSLWRWICLRGAGFPLSLVREMAVPACAAAADSLIVARHDVEERFQEFVAAVRSQMDLATDSQKRRALGGLLSQLNKGKVPDLKEEALESVRLQYCAARSRMEEAQRQFQDVFQEGVGEASARIERIAADPRFRQAVLLQNRRAVHFGLNSLRDRETQVKKRDKKERQSEELVANYVQRYCVKNDSIGFFGPVGWAQFVDDGESVTVKPGPSLLARSGIYFEQWAIDALAEKLAEGEALRPWMAPRMTPEAYLDGMHLVLADGTTLAVSPAEDAILKRCNGQWTARRIAAELITTQGSRVQTEQEVFQLLEKLVAQKIITWTLEVPVVLHPEHILRSLLERVEDEPVRKPAMEALDELDRARDEVSRAFGDVESLDNALVNLDATFTRLTGRSSTRHDGDVYAGRTLVYQDCERDLRMEVGPALVKEIGPPLSLLLTASRWFTYRSAALYRQAFQQAYEEVAAQSRSTAVDLLPLWIKVRRLIMSAPHRLFGRVVPEFQQRWADILRLPQGQRVQYTSAELKSSVEAAFAAPRAGWRMARHHSPDMMIAASSIDAIRRGDYLLVLGELHMAQNTVRPSWAMAQHPHPEEMFAAMQSDLPEERIQLVPPKSFRRYSGRARFVLTSPHDYLVELKTDSLSWHPPSRTLPISAFVIEPGADGLLARTRDGRLQFDFIEFCGEALSNEAVEYMDIIDHRPHVPRIMIDRMVIQRESWSFPGSELDFAQAESESERFLKARRWQRAHDLPRFIFVRVPVEFKPFYVDFESPVYVETFAKMVRRTLAEERVREKPINLVEMLPTCDQIWLPDSQGQMYTCEFRMVAFDLAE